MGSIPWEAVQGGKREEATITDWKAKMETV